MASTQSMLLELLEKNWSVHTLRGSAPELPLSSDFYILAALRSAEWGYILPTAVKMMKKRMDRHLGWDKYNKEFALSIDTLSESLVSCPVLRRTSYDDEELFRITTSGRIPLSVESISCKVVLLWDSKTGCYYGLVHPDRLAEFKVQFEKLIEILKSW